MYDYERNIYLKTGMFVCLRSGRDHRRGPTVTFNTAWQRTCCRVVGWAFLNYLQQLLPIGTLMWFKLREYEAKNEQIEVCLNVIW